MLMIFHIFLSSPTTPLKSGLHLRPETFPLAVCWVIHTSAIQNQALLIPPATPSSTFPILVNSKSSLPGAQPKTRESPLIPLPSCPMSHPQAHCAGTAFRLAQNSATSHHITCGCHPGLSSLSPSSSITAVTSYN